MAPADREGWLCGALITALEHSVAATNSPNVRYWRPRGCGKKRFLVVDPTRPIVHVGSGVDNCSGDALTNSIVSNKHFAFESAAALDGPY